MKVYVSFLCKEKKCIKHTDWNHLSFIAGRYDTLAEIEGICHSMKHSIWISKLLLSQDDGTVGGTISELLRSRLSLLEPMLSYEKLVTALHTTNNQNDILEFLSLVTKKWDHLSYKTDERVKKQFRFFKNSILVKYHIQQTLINCFQKQSIRKVLK